MSISNGVHGDLAGESRTGEKEDHGGAITGLNGPLEGQVTTIMGS